MTGFGCPPAVEPQLERTAALPGWTRIPPWWESDHAIFAMRGIPALAITSEGVHDPFTSVAHTDGDTLEIIDIDVLAGIVEVLGSMLPEIRPTLALGARM